MHSEDLSRPERRPDPRCPVHYLPDDPGSMDDPVAGTAAHLRSGDAGAPIPTLQRVVDHHTLRCGGRDERPGTRK